MFCGTSVDCVLDVVDDVLTSQVPGATIDILLDALSPLLNTLPYDLVIWSQIDSLIYHYKQPEELLSENIDIQIIVAGQKQVTGREAPDQSTTASLSSQGGFSFAEGNSESSDIFESAVEELPTSTELPSHSKDGSENVMAQGKRQVLLVSPGFGIMERMSEAQRLLRTGKLMRYRRYGLIF